METRVELDTPYRLEAADVAAFAEQGFIKLPQVASAELIDACQPEITREMAEHAAEQPPLSERDTYGRAFLQSTNLWQRSETIRELVFASRFAQLAAELLGVDGVRLYHDQALYKEPGGGFTPWHCDQHYWPLATDRCCTLWLPLQPTPLEMGPLTFAAGSHRVDLGRSLPISDASESELDRALAGTPIVQEPYASGEASFHLGRVFHRAAANTTAAPRRVMTVIYIDADMTIAEPRNENQKADLTSWFPGARPGQVPDTPLNPVLFRA
ncbi:MAG: phytanoyl-CoA dioxygenase family protein [Micromonosporaceae bacterium]